MGQLHDRMHADLTLRRYARSTVVKYLRLVATFVAFFGRPPLRLGLDEIRRFLLHLVEEKKVSPAVHKMYVASPISASSPSTSMASASPPRTAA